MRYTNYLKLPQPLVDAIVNDDYSKGDAKYSITGLLTPPQISALMREHSERIVEDVSDRLPALFGKLVHKLLEEREREGFAEPVLFFHLDGVKIKAGLDRLVVSQQHLDDYKFVSLYKFYKGGTRSLPREYEEQMAGYKYALSTADYHLMSCDIVAMYRDFKKGVMLRSNEGEYPQAGAERFSVPMWPLETARGFLHHRLSLHESAARGIVTECTTEERWEDPQSFAVMKKGSKRAMRVHPTLTQAAEHIGTTPEKDRDQYSVQIRKGVSKRCESWCSVADVCPQWARIQREQGRATPGSFTEANEQGE